MFYHISHENHVNWSNKAISEFCQNSTKVGNYFDTACFLGKIPLSESAQLKLKTDLNIKIIIAKCCWIFSLHVERPKFDIKCHDFPQKALKCQDKNDCAVSQKMNSVQI